MIDLTVLTYVPDPFAVQASRFCLKTAEGEVRFLSASELGSVRGPILTYDVPALIDDLRRLNQSPPTGLVDIGEALRLKVGLPRDEGGEKRWNLWRALSRHFRDTEQAKLFQSVVQARHERPDTEELSALLSLAADALSRLWIDLAKHLGRDELERLFLVEWPLQKIFSHRQFRGVPVDSTGATALLTSLSEEKYSAYRVVAETLKMSPTGLNFWNIQEHLRNTDVSHLSDVEPGGRLQDAFEIASTVSMFAGAFLTMVKAARDEAVVRRAVGADDRLHPFFSILGTVSGRILVSDPYLQQLRRAYRSLIVAEPRKRLIYLDYAQFEPGVLAGLVDDDDLIAAYNEGDLYTALAMQLFGSSEMRSVAKRVFLAFSYGMTPERISLLLAGKNEESSLREAYAQQISAFFARFPALERFKSDQQSKLRSEGSVGSLVGNKRYRVTDGDLTSKEKRWALNQPVQATASLIFKEALLKISDAVGMDAILLPVHDAVLLQFDEDGFESLTERSCEIMVESFSARFPKLRPKVTAGAFA
ncbi:MULTISPECIES: DNA polymerase [Sphingomonas]|uniref:DNA polymerase n=1 Tax=Sphingomonas TaxID=13687 RepID=UPI0013B465A1|nr:MULTISPECIES: DNA polymerase [Sphingomonas]